MKKWIDAVTKIAKSEDAVKIEFDAFELKVLTAKQICLLETETTRQRYLIPACNIIFRRTEDETVRIIFEEHAFTDSRDGFWAKQIHPHISNNGMACWGNIEGDVQVALAEEDYYLAWQLAVAFLRSVNIEDIAGQAICHWDEVDTYGNIIMYGHEIRLGEYGGDVDISAGLSQYAGLVEYDGELYDEDELCTCECCCERHPEENMTYVNDMPFCERCIEEYFIECDVCGEYVEIDYGHITGDDRIICEDCFQNVAVFCEACEEWFLDEDMTEIDGMQCCSACAEEAYECEVCGELTFDPRTAGDMTVCYECLMDYEAAGDNPIPVAQQMGVDERLQPEQLHLEKCVICGELTPLEDTVDFYGVKVCKKCEVEYNNYAGETE